MDKKDVLPAEYLIGQGLAKLKAEETIPFNRYIELIDSFQDFGRFMYDIGKSLSLEEKAALLEQYGIDVDIDSFGFKK